MYPAITYSLLVEKKACPIQLALFKKYFGEVNAIPLTDEVVTKFGSLFDIDWAAVHLLTQDDFEEYEKGLVASWAEYRKVIVPAYAEYCKVNDPAMKKYIEVVVPVPAEYDKVIAPAYEEYEKVRDTVWKKHQKAIAQAFVEIYKKGMKTS